MIVTANPTTFLLHDAIVKSLANFITTTISLSPSSSLPLLMTSGSSRPSHFFITIGLIFIFINPLVPPSQLAIKAIDLSLFLLLPFLLEELKSRQESNAFLMNPLKILSLPTLQSPLLHSRVILNNDGLLSKMHPLHDTEPWNSNTGLGCRHLRDDVLELTKLIGAGEAREGRAGMVGGWRGEEARKAAGD